MEQTEPKSDTTHYTKKIEDADGGSQKSTMQKSV
jgi:hypothetical protein